MTALAERCDNHGVPQRPVASTRNLQLQLSFLLWFLASNRQRLPSQCGWLARCEVKRRTQLLLRTALLFARPLNYELAARGSRTIAIRLRKPRHQFLDVRRADAGDLIVAWAAVKRAIASGLDIPECRRSHQPIQRWV